MALTNKFALEPAKVTELNSFLDEIFKGLDWGFSGGIIGYISDPAGVNFQVFIYPIQSFLPDF